MNEIKNDLETLEERLHDKEDRKQVIGRILILIDDLDRCEPDKAVEVLQAINLLLDFNELRRLPRHRRAHRHRARSRTTTRTCSARPAPPATSTSTRSSRSRSASPSPTPHELEGLRREPARRARGAGPVRRRSAPTDGGQPATAPRARGAARRRAAARPGGSARRRRRRRRCERSAAVPRGRRAVHARRAAGVRGSERTCARTRATSSALVNVYASCGRSPARRDAPLLLAPSGGDHPLARALQPVALRLARDARPLRADARRARHEAQLLPPAYPDEDPLLYLLEPGRPPRLPRAGSGSWTTTSPTSWR